MKLRTSFAAPVTFLALIAASCGDNAADNATPLTTTAVAATRAATTTSAVQVEETVTGVVIAVEGNLAGIDSFVIRLPDGSDLALVPAEGLLFDDVAPLNHVRDHLVSGNPVTVKYMGTLDGLPTAHAIGDASRDIHDDH